MTRRQGSQLSVPILSHVIPSAATALSPIATRHTAFAVIPTWRRKALESEAIGGRTRVNRRRDRRFARYHPRPTPQSTPSTLIHSTNAHTKHPPIRLHVSCSPPPHILCNIRRNQTLGRNQSPHNTSSPGEPQQRAKPRSAQRKREGNERKKVPAYMRCSHAGWPQARIHASMHARHVQRASARAQAKQSKKQPHHT